MWLAIRGTTGTWLMSKLMVAQLSVLRLRGLEGEDVGKGPIRLQRVGGEGECHPDGCKECKTRTCYCYCGLKKGSTASSSQRSLSQQHSLTYSSAASASGPVASSREEHPTLSPQLSTGATAATPVPYIIAPVALIIVVVCVMIYFRIRPFHRVRYLLRS
ncbi:hypothetical protein BBBOND_0305030 [Babesia bigemina]|uniref:Uncharacterized protein n=1 Tax=Babesia bigemina TaxID=5866 RepID=A0A061DDV2_BABBI|nr:hypothetical protein BBBOND_0305030 [Babesia bigemina]CDR96600.1 hypothetical protein BBBOND_0305030 [Babesia bigemina]|eukprot:XP_012768786.1 hypothetical protein BBBOND_0305030 [Babesia bigemina]